MPILKKLAAISTLVALLVGLSGCSNKNKEREEGRKQLVQQVAQQIQAAEQKMNEYDFDAANSLLYQLREDVQGSSYADVATNDKLIADIDAAHAVLSDKKSDFFHKKGQGYSLVEGKLISPAEQKRINALPARQDHPRQSRGIRPPARDLLSLSILQIHRVQSRLQRLKRNRRRRTSLHRHFAVAVPGGDRGFKGSRDRGIKGSTNQATWKIATAIRDIAEPSASRVR